jgi:hypothetical protein
MATDTTTPSAPNKAQAEFDKYARRRDAQAAGFGPFPGDGLSWNVPLGVGMAPADLDGPRLGGAVRDIEKAAGGVAESLGTTVRLGVDLLNAALFSGVKILGGFTGAYGGQYEHGCGCESCCEPECCEPDCCGCGCCRPGVGSCC